MESLGLTCGAGVADVTMLYCVLGVILLWRISFSYTILATRSGVEDSATRLQESC